LRGREGGNGAHNKEYESMERHDDVLSMLGMVAQLGDFADLSRFLNVIQTDGMFSTV